MSKSLVVASSGVVFQIPDNSTKFINIAGGLANIIESQTELPVRAAGIFSNLYINCTGNTNTVAGTTCTLKKSGVDTALTVTYGASESGVKEDITNIISFANTDVVCIKIVCPDDVTGARFFNLALTGLTFTPDDGSNTWSWLSHETTATLSTDSASRYFVPSGANTGLSAVEASAQFTIRDSFTSSNLWAVVSSNARTTDTTIRTRINTANGNQLVVFGSTESGQKEDASNTDSLVAGDLYNYSLTTSTGGGNFVMAQFATLLKSTDGNFQMIWGSLGGAATPIGTTRYFAVNNGRGLLTGTESTSQIAPKFNFRASNFSVYVETNTLTTASLTFRLRDNGANGNQSVVYAAGETGYKTDATNVDYITGGSDEINYSCTTSAGGSGAHSCKSIGCIGNDKYVINLDSTSNSGYNTADANYSWSHTCNGVNRYLLVSISMLSVGGSSVSSIDYNGDALTLIRARASGAGAVREELWGLVNPDIGSNTITVALSAALDSIGGAISLTGVNQTTPTEGDADASATNIGAADATVNVTTVAENDWVLDGVATDDTAITVGAGQTSNWNITGTLGSGAGSYEPKGVAGTVTMSWTDVGALATWTIVAVAIRPAYASSGAAADTPLRMLTGIGL